jgi:hypothetical protein
MKSDPHSASAANKATTPPQLDTGYFYLIQGGLRVGELVVRDDVPNSSDMFEHWFLYNSAGNTPGTTAAYTRPSSSSVSVELKFVYQAVGANLQTIWDTAKANGNQPAYESAHVVVLNSRPANP